MSTGGDDPEQHCRPDDLRWHPRQGDLSSGPPWPGSGTSGSPPSTRTARWPRAPCARFCSGAGADCEPACRGGRW
ncbi:hypothetical protein HBB16_04995 [Pseudonocardia sp. MCCB 268]|nr:hypothetical protein [Pseudonocardia cytotoxica]